MEDKFADELDSIKPYLFEEIVLEEKRFILDKCLCDIAAQAYKSRNVKEFLAGAIELKKRYKVLSFVHIENRVRVEKYIDEKIANGFEEYHQVKLAFSGQDLDELMTHLK